MKFYFFFAKQIGFVFWFIWSYEKQKINERELFEIMIYCDRF